MLKCRGRRGRSQPNRTSLPAGRNTGLASPGSLPILGFSRRLSQTPPLHHSHDVAKELERDWMLASPSCPKVDVSEARGRVLLRFYYYYYYYFLVNPSVPCSLFFLLELLYSLM